MWHLRPALGALVAAAAALAVVAALLGRGVWPRVGAAAVVVIAGALLVVDARGRAGDVLLADAGVARASWWLLVPVLGGLVAAAGLLLVARGGAPRQRGT